MITARILWRATPPALKWAVALLIVALGIFYAGQRHERAQVRETIKQAEEQADKIREEIEHEDDDALADRITDPERMR